MPAPLRMAQGPWQPAETLGTWGRRCGGETQGCLKTETTLSLVIFTLTHP